MIIIMFFALLSTFRAFWYVSRRDSASHMSTECGTHSTARPSIKRASSGGSRSIAACHSLTELGTTSSALRRTRRRIVMFDSSDAACHVAEGREGQPGRRAATMRGGVHDGAIRDKK